MSESVYVVFRTYRDSVELVNNYTAETAEKAVKRAHEDFTGREATTVEEIDVQGSYMVFPYDSMQSFSIEEGEIGD